VAEAGFAAVPAGVLPLVRRRARHLGAPITDAQFHTGLRWPLEGIRAQARRDGRDRQPPG
jgi:hypothetical protein